MYKILTTLVIIAFLSSCEREQKPKPCPIVASENVPTAVSKAFSTKYPSENATTTTWFNKDNTGFVALFTKSGTKTLCQFDNQGNVVTEKTEGQRNCKHHESDDDKGCECDTDND